MPRKKLPPPKYVWTGPEFAAWCGERGLSITDAANLLMVRPLTIAIYRSRGLRPRDLVVLRLLWSDYQRNGGINAYKRLRPNRGRPSPESVERYSPTPRAPGAGRPPSKER